MSFRTLLARSLGSLLSFPKEKSCFCLILSLAWSQVALLRLPHVCATTCSNMLSLLPTLLGSFCHFTADLSSKHLNSSHDLTACGLHWTSLLRSHHVCFDFYTVFFLRDVCCCCLWPCMRAICVLGHSSRHISKSFSLNHMDANQLLNLPSLPTRLLFGPIVSFV